MQGSIGVAVIAAAVALFLVAGTSSLPIVAGISAIAGIAVVFDQWRTRSSRSTR
jgi:hypothetical protein